MAWVRIEDAVTEHRKHLKAGPAACWLWVCGICYCQRQLSDGFIPEEAIPMLGVVKGYRPLLDRLVEVGLFERVEGGYRVHDYHDYNATKEEARERMTAMSEQRRQAGIASGRSRRGQREQKAPVEQNANGPVRGPVEQNGNGPVERLLNPIPSHPIPSVQRTNGRSRRPVFTGQRFAVFEWQLDDLSRLLGPHFEAFGIDEFFFALDAKAAASGQVIPQRDGGSWLQAQVIAEAQRRGLAIAAAAPARPGPRSTVPNAEATRRHLQLEPER